MPVNLSPQGGEVCCSLKEPRTLLTNDGRCGREGDRGWFRGLHGQESLSPKGGRWGRVGAREAVATPSSVVSDESHAGRLPGLGLRLWN